MVLLDTHVLLWWFADEGRLSRRAAREIAKAGTVLVSAVSFWEIATLLRKGRIALDSDVYVWIADLLREDHIAMAPLSAQAALDSGLLPDDFPGDPADRLLYATAQELIVPMVTKDMKIRSYAAHATGVTAIW